MNKIKYLVLSLVFLNINFSNAMERRLVHTSIRMHYDPKITSNAKKLARFFVAEINNLDTYKIILTNLRTTRDHLGLDVNDKLPLACFFENFSNVLLNYFNTKDSAGFSVAALTLPLDFEVFFRRINEVCSYEQEQLMRLLFPEGSVEITEINDFTQKLEEVIGEEFYKFITRANILSTIKYSLHDERVRAVVVKNLLRFKLGSFRKFRKYLGESNFGSPLLAGEDKISSMMGILEQINTDLTRVNFLA